MKPTTIGEWLEMPESDRYYILSMYLLDMARDGWFDDIEEQHDTQDQSTD